MSSTDFYQTTTHIGGDLAPSLGGRKKCRGPNFWMTSLGSYFHFDIENFWWPFFNHWPYIVALLPVSAVNLIWCNICDLFLAKKPLFQNKTLLHLFLVCSYFATHPITLLLEILGDGCVGRPPTSNFGGPSLPVPPKFLPMTTHWI